MRPTIALIAFLLAAPAAASPITTNLTGDCVAALPAEGASWQSTSHFRFAVFWDDALDCDATIAHGYAPIYRFDNFDGTGGLRIEMPADALYACKKHQIDWQEVLADGSLGRLGAIIVNPALNGSCQSGTSALHLPGPRNNPGNNPGNNPKNGPKNNPGNNPGNGPKNGPEPPPENQGPPPTPVPESGSTLLLVLIAACAIAIKRQTMAARRHPQAG